MNPLEGGYTYSRLSFSTGAPPGFPGFQVVAPTASGKTFIGYYVMDKVQQRMHL